MSNVGKPFWGWILKDCIKVREKKKGSHCLVFTSATKCEIRHFQVVVVQWRQRSEQKSGCMSKIIVLLIYYLLLFWPSHCCRHQHPHYFWFAAILSCSHSLYFIPLSAPLHFHFLPVWKVLMHALHWAYSSGAQIATGWEHYLTYNVCTDAPSPQKNSGKRRLCCANINCVPQMSLSPTFFFLGEGAHVRRLLDLGPGSCSVMKTPGNRRLPTSTCSCFIFFLPCT